MAISETIKNIRMSLYLEQEEFGKLIGVTKSSVCNYEQGHRRPRLPTIRKIMDLVKKHKLKIKPEDFLS